MSDDLVLIEFQLENRPKAWSTNQDRRINPYDRAEMVKLWKESARHAYRRLVVANKAPGKGYGHKVVVMLDIPVADDHRRRDPHNYCGTVLKAVIDGLVKAGMAPDDTPEYVGHREPQLVPDPTGRALPRVRLIMPDV